MIARNFCLKLIVAGLRAPVLSVVCLGMLLVGAAGTASAMGINGLLGVVPGFPQIDGNSTIGQGATFTPTGGGAGVLEVESTPNLYFSDPNSLTVIQDGFLQMVAVIDSAGNSPASVTIAWGSAGALTTPLLIANILGFGLENSSLNPGGTDRADFLLNPVGGSILFDPNWIAGSLVAMTMTLENSTYNGNLNEAWRADRVKFVVGQLPAALPEPATLPLLMIGLAGFLYMQRRTAKITD